MQSKVRNLAIYMKKEDSYCQKVGFLQKLALAGGFPA